MFGIFGYIDDDEEGDGVGDILLLATFAILLVL